MRKIRVALLCAGLAGLTSPALASQNVVGLAVQRLHLSPQQLLSLRDFIGPFNRGTEVDASGDGLFVLRDAATMAYSGEFSIRVSSSGRLEIDRIDGPARLDSFRTVLFPVRLTDKARTQVMMALAHSEAAKPDVPMTAETMDRVEPPPVLPAVSVAALASTVTTAPQILTQSRAEFWPDGSGWSASFRVQPASPVMRLSERYFAPVRADAAKVWRDSVVEIDGDLKFALAQFEDRFRCPADGTCAPRYISPENGLHVIRWSKTLIPAVPPSLMAKIATPVIAPPIAQPSTEPSVTGTEAEPSPQTAPTTPADESAQGAPNGR